MHQSSVSCLRIPVFGWVGDDSNRVLLSMPFLGEQEPIVNEHLPVLGDQIVPSDGRGTITSTSICVHCLLSITFVTISVSSCRLFLSKIIR